jgi:hypothetical protein
MSYHFLGQNTWGNFGQILCILLPGLKKDCVLCVCVFLYICVGECYFSTSESYFQKEKLTDMD